MSLFQRSVKNEISNQASVVFSTLVVIWISVLLVRLLGEAAAGRIGADVVVGIAAFSSINALPTIVCVSVFVGVMTTVTRNYRESEMVVWFASGLSLKDWLRPVLRFALPAAALVAVLTLLASPWAYQQIADYRARYEQRSDVSRVTPGQFLESGGTDRVFFVESGADITERIGNVFVRWIENGRLNVLTAGSSLVEERPNGDRFLVLESGQRYELVPDTPEFRLMRFEKYGVRLESRAPAADGGPAGKARSTSQLLESGAGGAGELLWRISLPLVAINLALLAVPLGAVNPRLGKSGDFVIAVLIALLYLNLVNLGRAWVDNGQVGFFTALVGLHGAVALLTAALLHLRMRMKRPPPAR